MSVDTPADFATRLRVVDSSPRRTGDQDDARRKGSTCETSQRRAVVRPTRRPRQVKPRSAEGFAVAHRGRTPLADVLRAQAEDVREAERRELLEAVADGGRDARPCGIRDLADDSNVRDLTADR